MKISTVGVINNIVTARRLSEVYDTHRQTTLTAPETISRFTDMVSAHQKLNCSRDLTTPLSGMVCNPTYLPTKFKVYNSHHYENMKGDTKCRKWGGLG